MAISLWCVFGGLRFYIRDGETTFARALAVAYRDHNEEAGAHWNAPIDAPTRAAIRAVVARRKFAEQYGRAPADGRELTGYIAHETRARTTAVAGYDLTFSPVKSVSALCGRTGRLTPEQRAQRDSGAALSARSLPIWSAWSGVGLHQACSDVFALGSASLCVNSQA